MTAGQGALVLGGNESAGAAPTASFSGTRVLVRPRVQRASADEAAAHANRLAALDKTGANGSVWRSVEGAG
jgi:DNA polymerase-3 subunit epsilon